LSNARSPSRPFIRLATREDLSFVARHIRAEDADEVWHSSKSLPYAALLHGFNVSNPALAVERLGAPVAILGVVGVPGAAGSPWMLATPDMANCGGLLRECRRMVNGWATEYRCLTNFVWSKNTGHISWLKWLGFSFHGSELRNGETFLQFHKAPNV